MSKLLKYLQLGGEAQQEVLAEKGEIFQDADGNIHQVSNQAPSHDSNNQIDKFNIKKVSKGDGGVVISANSVLSDSHSQVKSGSRKNNEKEKAVRIEKEQATNIAEMLGLRATIKSHLSPSKLFVTLLEAKDKEVKKIEKSQDNATKSRFNESSLKANISYLNSLPKDEDIYNIVFNLQESNKDNSGLDFQEETKSQYGNSTYVQKPISPFLIAKNKKDVLEENWNERQTNISTTKNISKNLKDYYEEKQLNKEAKERIDERQGKTNMLGLALSPVPVVGEIYNTANTLANGVVDLAQGDYSDVAISGGLLGLSKLPLLKNKSWNSLDAPKGNLYGEHQTIIQQKRLLNPEIKDKFFQNQNIIKEEPLTRFSKPPKDLNNRITKDNYEEFVNKIHSKTDYDLSSTVSKNPNNLGIGNYNKSGMVFKDAPLNKLQKDIINAHEKNHGVFAGTLSKNMKKELLSPFGGIGMNPIKGYSNTHQSDEILARMGQFKNAVGIGDNQTFTKGHLDLIRKNYAKNFIDNGITDMLKKIPRGSKAEQLFLENMNKFAFGSIPLALISENSISKNQYGSKLDKYL